MLRNLSAAQPDRDAYVFLDSRTEPPRRYSYGSLDAEARSIAAALQQLLQLLRPGDRVLLLFPPGVEFIEPHA